MTNTILRLPAVLERTGLSRSTVCLMVSKAKFPAPVSLGERAVGWVESQVDQWVDDKIAASQEQK